MMPEPVRSPIADIVTEAERLLADAMSQQIPLRALGGVAVRLRAGSRMPAALHRELKDIDLATTRLAGPDVAGLLADAGYEANERFNAMHGHKRMLFYDTGNQRQLDVFVHSFAMCHDIPIAERLELEPYTLPLAELVMTKLQIVELNHKDLTDLFALFLIGDVADEDGESINRERIADLCGADWGLHRTFELNLSRIREALGSSGLSPSDRALVKDRVERLADALNAAPKSRRWKLRARVGERVRWYTEPDEVAEPA